MLLDCLPGAGLGINRNQTDSCFQASHGVFSCGLWLPFNSLLPQSSHTLSLLLRRLGGKEVAGLGPSDGTSWVSIRQLLTVSSKSRHWLNVEGRCWQPCCFLILLVWGCPSLWTPTLARHGLCPDTRALFPGSGETTSSCAPPPLEWVLPFNFCAVS